MKYFSEIVRHANKSKEMLEKFEKKLKENLKENKIDQSEYGFFTSACVMDDGINLYLSPGDNKDTIFFHIYLDKEEVKTEKEYSLELYSPKIIKLVEDIIKSIIYVSENLDSEEESDNDEVKEKENSVIQ